MNQSNYRHSRELINEFRNHLEAMPDEAIEIVMQSDPDPLTLLIPCKRDPGYMKRVLIVAFQSPELLRSLPRYIPSALIIEALLAHYQPKKAASLLASRVPHDRISQVMLDFLYDQKERMPMSNLHPSLYTESNILKAIEITPSSYIHVPTEYCTRAVMYAAYCHMPALFSGFPKQYQNEELVLHGVKNGVSLNQVPHPFHWAVYQAWKAEPNQFNLKGIESFPDSPEKALRDLRIPKLGKREKSQHNDALLICYLKDKPLQAVWDATRHKGEQEFLYSVFGSKLLDVTNVPDRFKRKWLEQDLGL